jgi:hypothetical protein
VTATVVYRMVKVPPAALMAAPMLFADRKGAPPGAEAVRRMVTTVIAGVAHEPRP